MPPLPSTTSSRPTERSTGVVGPQRTEQQYPAGRWQPPPAATAPAAAAAVGAGRRKVRARLAAVLPPLPTCSQTRKTIAGGWKALDTATAGKLSTTVAVERNGQGSAAPPTQPIVVRLPNPISGIRDRLAAVLVGAVACAGAAGAAVAAVAAGPPPRRARRLEAAARKRAGLRRPAAAAVRTTTIAACRPSQAVAVPAGLMGGRGRAGAPTRPLIPRLQDPISVGGSLWGAEAGEGLVAGAGVGLSLLLYQAAGWVRVQAVSVVLAGAAGVAGAAGAAGAGVAGAIRPGLQPLAG